MLQCTAAKPTKGNHNLGYTLCMAIACENGCRRIVPLMLRLWSSVHPEYASFCPDVWHVIRVARNGKIDKNRARPREGSVAVSKTGDKIIQ